MVDIVGDVVDYRKKLIMVLPSVEEVSTRKHSFGSKISEAEDSAQQCSVNIDSVRREIEQLKDKRR